jgi:hypothetical protein
MRTPPQDPKGERYNVHRSYMRLQNTQNRLRMIRSCTLQLRLDNVQALYKSRYWYNVDLLMTNTVLEYMFDLLPISRLLQVWDSHVNRFCRSMHSAVVQVGDAFTGMGHLIASLIMPRLELSVDTDRFVESV